MTLRARLRAQDRVMGTGACLGQERGQGKGVRSQSTPDSRHAAHGKAVIGGTAVRGTTQWRHPMLNRCELHNAPACSACAEHTGVSFCCQWRHKEQRAQPLV